MFLLIFIYALIGMQFFGLDLIDENGEIPRSNFGTFSMSLLTIFQVLTGENWNEAMYVVIYNYGYGASIYFVTLIVLGNFMLLNLFLAILLKHISDNVTEGEEDSDDEESVEDDDPAPIIEN
jgi:voltage-dependent calcium channel N type alpha-1B